MKENTFIRDEEFDEVNCYDEKVYNSLLEEYFKETENCKAETVKALEYMKEHIDYPFEDVEEYLEGECSHVGYVKQEDIYLDKNYKENGYSSYDFYRFKNVIKDAYHTEKIYMKQNEGYNNAYVLIYQTVGIVDDDYNGYLLFPLNDGTYWVIYFNC